MAHLGDSDLSERNRIIYLALATSGVILFTTAVFAAAEAYWVFTHFSQKSWEVNAAFHLSLWSSVMLLVSRSRQIFRAMKFAIKRAALMLLALPALLIRITWRIAIVVCRATLGIVPALLRLALGDGYELISAKLRPWCDPAFSIKAAVVSKIAHINERVLAVRAALAKERALKAAYRTEFKDHYPSYRAFRAAFAAKGETGSKQKLAADPFAAACAVFGLRADGNFTHEEFKARYRAAMKAHHPDMAGGHERAAAINEAAMTIKRRKDWK